MRRFLLGIAMMMASICCQSATKQALTLYTESGSLIVYLLDSEPIIRFVGQSMMVTVGENTDVIAMEDVNRWEVGIVDESGTEIVLPDRSEAIIVDGSSVSIYNPRRVSVAVVSINGLTVGYGDAAELHYRLPHGVYVVKIASKSYKIVVR